MHALWSIGEIGPKQAPKAVMAMLKDKDREVRELAAWALYEMEDPDAAPALEAALKTEIDKDMQISYIRALAAIGEKSVDALRGLLESNDQRIKTMAVKALAGGQADGPWPWPMPDPRPYP
jgi:HEAT repeat protein